ncbi:hypothetical protein BMS3Bbin05_00025 [bacterium BMS3Bbin05]|nr:hypothetical protein BMS3Bbin05_00025 [bacterium BMS3Bbin05]
MFDKCKGVQNWFNCLNCTCLSTYLCPLEGEDAIDRIAARIKMMEDPAYDGFKKEINRQ